jgi:hypothetical protein
MKVLLESTDKVVTFNGIEARLWQGTTESGVECHAFITRIGVDKTADVSQFERELLEKPAPHKAEFDVYPLRMVL